jgi:hypothetical protein
MPTTNDYLPRNWNDSAACEPWADDYEWPNRHERKLFEVGERTISRAGQTKSTNSAGSSSPTSDVFLRKLSNIHFNNLEKALHNLLDESASLVERRLATPYTSIVVPVVSLAPEAFEVLSAIQVVVQGQDGDFTATFFDANIGASGETQQEAVCNLKELLIMSFESLADDDAASLGPLMKKQKAVLEKFMKRTQSNADDLAK